MKPQQKTKEPQNLEKAYEYAVFLLSLKLRTVGEIREKMTGRGYVADVTEKVIRQLCDQKYLDDKRYAEVFLENLKTYKLFGFYGIKKKFAEKKLPKEIIEEALQEGLSLLEEIKIAQKLLKKEGFTNSAKAQTEENQYRTFDEDANKEKQKIAQKLRARGFRSEVVSRLLF